MRWFATEFSYSVISCTFSSSSTLSGLPSSVRLVSGLCCGEASGDPTLSADRVARGVSWVHKLHLKYEVKDRHALGQLDLLDRVTNMASITKLMYA